MNRSQVRIAAVIAACAGGTSSLQAQTSTALLHEGDALPGAPGFTVSTIGECAANNVGGFANQINTSDGVNTISRSWGNAIEAPGALLWSEQTGIAGYDQTSWEGFFGIDDMARTGYSPSCNAIGGATGLDCTWVDGTPIAVEGQSIPTVPGKVYRFNSRVGMTGSGDPYWIGGINDGTSGASEGEGLFYGAAQISVIKTGDVSPAPLTSTISSGDFDVRYSANGSHWIMNVDTTEPTASDEWLLIDGAIATCAGGGMVGEGQVIPVAAGGNGVDLWTATFGSLGINEAGDHCYEADTNGATTSDAVIVYNGVIRWREGDVVGGLTLTGAPTGLSLNESGDVVHTWSTTGSVEAIFLNDTLIVKEGDTVDWTGDGVLDAGFVITDITGTTAVVLGSAGAIYFTADVDTNGGGVLEGFFRVRGGSSGSAFCAGDGSGTACPCANNSMPGLEEGCLNSFGMGGKLIASGTASLSSDTILFQGSQMPNSSALYFQGTAQANGGLGSVFGDGLRCAGGSIVRLKTVSNSGGASQYPQMGDPSVSVRGLVMAPGMRTYQVWYRNAAAFCNAETFNLTNGWTIDWTL